MSSNGSRSAIIALALLLCGGASPPSGVTETITIRRSAYFCLGPCPAYEITVHPDGRLVADHIMTFQLPLEGVSRLHALLAPFRRSDAQANCTQPLPGSRSVLDPEPLYTDIEITWSGTPEARLLICRGPDYRRLANAINCALAAVDFSPMGDPLPSGHRVPIEAGGCPAELE